jgi:hypothetical protein
MRKADISFSSASTLDQGSVEAHDGRPVVFDRGA